jgi:hypothetical protein
MAMTFGKAGAMAKAKQLAESADKWFFIDDNVGLKCLTNHPVNKKIIGWEVRWKNEESVKFMVKSKEFPNGHATILKAYQAVEKYLDGKK